MMCRWISVFLLCLMIATPHYAQDDTLTPYEIALQRIEEANEANATDLFLGGLDLTELPPEIGQLIGLEALHLAGNQLTTLPPEIGQLSNLQILDLYDNQLTSLPPEIGNLSNLCILDLSRNNLRHLPNSISKLNSLVQGECSIHSFSRLYLGKNPLISPPPEVVEQGTAAVLSYLRNQAWYHTQRLIIGAAGGVGLFALLVIGFRWKQRNGRKLKQKRV